jgi:4-hydroxy-3-methylbut-2-en-1-yl diphosphate synthase IspG/GcpE
MTTTKTADVDGTLAQVYALAGAGADIVRITCNEVEAAQGLESRDSDSTRATSAKKIKSRRWPARPASEASRFG